MCEKVKLWKPNIIGWKILRVHLKRFYILGFITSQTKRWEVNEKSFLTKPIERSKVDISFRTISTWQQLQSKIRTLILKLKYLDKCSICSHWTMRLEKKPHGGEQNMLNWPFTLRPSTFSLWKEFLLNFVFLYVLWLTIAHMIVNLETTSEPWENKNYDVQFNNNVAWSSQQKRLTSTLWGISFSRISRRSSLIKLYALAWWIRQQWGMKGIEVRYSCSNCLKTNLLIIPINLLTTNISNTALHASQSPVAIF